MSRTEELGAAFGSRNGLVRKMCVGHGRQSKFNDAVRQLSELARDPRPLFASRGALRRRRSATLGLRYLQPQVPLECCAPALCQGELLLRASSASRPESRRSAFTVQVEVGRVLM